VPDFTACLAEYIDGKGMKLSFAWVGNAVNAEAYAAASSDPADAVNCDCGCG
jgi:hypothetical protein